MSDAVGNSAKTLYTLYLAVDAPCPHYGVSEVPSEIVMMDAGALAEAIRAKKVSCVEVMNAYLDHIDRLNPKVNAIVALQDGAGLLAQAREKDDELARGAAVGPLHGFPFAVKDLAPVKGIPMTMGSPILKDNVPAADSVMVARIRAAGAIFVGKTNTPEFGFGSNTYNPVYGATLNAYDQTRSAGGSSGGAAVSLALRMLPVAGGSDNAGSLRNPAGWNNVFGFRTSYGRVPVEGRDPFIPNMTVAGPMARTVPDLALLLSVQAGYDARAPLSIAGDGAAFRAPFTHDFRGARIAWSGDFGGTVPHESDVLHVCKAALKAFEDLGCTVEEARPDFSTDELWAAYLALRAWHAAGPLIAWYRDPATQALFKPEAVFEIESAMKLSALDIAAAGTVRARWCEAVRRFFVRYDFFVVPTAQLFPFDARIHWPAEVAGEKMAGYLEWQKGMIPITMAGLPALAVPAGFNAAGLPMGLQIAGPNQSEFACLQLAHAYDLATGWTKTRLPPLLAP
jgi:amidase